MAKTRRCTFRGEDADFDRWEAAAAELHYHEFGDYVRRALDELTARLSSGAFPQSRAGLLSERVVKTQAKPDPKKKERKK